MSPGWRGCRAGTACAGALRLVLGLALALGACNVDSGPSDDGGGVPGFRLEPVAQGLSQPLYLTAPTGDARLFILERTGAVRIVSGEGTLLSTPFLDLSAELSSGGGEQGLLGMAFHPSYAVNGRFFVSYTDVEGDSRVVEYAADPASDVADPGSARPLLHVEQPFANHNGGQVSFGPDGMLYVGLGDGGSAADPMGNGQNLETLLGTILRLDVDGEEPYAIPPDNPFVGDPEARDEIWAYGLRNPWRFAWDPVDELFFVADVGQNRWEEVNLVPEEEGGINYGWRTMEGPDCFVQPGCNQEGLHIPQIQYAHDLGCSVTGGVPYRGTELPALTGRYLFADFCEGWIRVATVEGVSLTEVVELDLEPPGSITSFGTDADGEVYVLVAEGTVFRMAQAPL